MAVSEQTKEAFFAHLQQEEGLILTRAQSDSLLIDLVKLLRLINKQGIER